MSEEHKDPILEYRQHLILAEQKAQEDYDKTLVTLSGGALGISVAFIEKVIGKGTLVEPNLLRTSWICWAVSLLAVLASYFVSRKALRSAIQKVDQGKSEEIRQQGGVWSFLTEAFNWISGITFVIGVILLILFAVQNLESKNDREVEEASEAESQTVRLPTTTASQETAVWYQAKSLDEQEDALNGVEHVSSE